LANTSPQNFRDRSLSPFPEAVGAVVQGNENPQLRDFLGKAMMTAVEQAANQIKFFESNPLPEMVEAIGSPQDKVLPSPRVRALWELTETLFEMHWSGGIPWGDLFKKLDSPALGRWAIVLEEALRFETSERWGWGKYSQIN
jgi:hypothetical protein